MDLGDNTDEPEADETVADGSGSESGTTETATVEAASAASPGGSLEYEERSGRGSVSLPLTDGPGGFVSNPDTSRGTLKLVFPASYADRIGSVVAFTGDGTPFDGFNRTLPNEHDGRPRYYGTKSIAEYPANLSVRVTFVDGTVGALVIPNPKQRYD